MRESRGGAALQSYRWGVFYTVPRSIGDYRGQNPDGDQTEGHR